MSLITFRLLVLVYSSRKQLACSSVYCLILKLNDGDILLSPFLSSQKNHRYSRLYLNFKRPEDVVEFAEVFSGHVFVNEKGIFFILLNFVHDNLYSVIVSFLEHCPLDLLVYRILFSLGECGRRDPRETH